MKWGLKYLLLSTFLMLAGSALVDAQPCLPDGITFTTQSQIDSFPINYPNCTEIVGYLRIHGDNIVDLNPLQSLTKVDSSVFISANASLTTLIGLHNINYIGGMLSININTSLQSLNEFGDLTYLGGSLYIENNAQLTDLSGLESLDSIHGKLWINNNTNLESLSGLDSICYVQEGVYIYGSQSLTTLEHLSQVVYIGNELRIDNNPLLSNLHGFENITSLGGGLDIQFNPLLTDLSGLENIQSIGLTLSLYFNDNLVDLSDLNNLTSIDGNIVIWGNQSLNSLSGLDNIDESTIQKLFIWDNPSLSTCEVQSICDYISSPNAVVDIHGNTTGCNSQEEVEQACESLSIPKNDFNSLISIYPNPSNSEVFINGVADHSPVEVSIYNMAGQQVLHQQGSDRSIDVSSLQEGMYMVEVIIDDRRFRLKLIVK